MSASMNHEAARFYSDLAVPLYVCESENGGFARVNKLTIRPGSAKPILLGDEIPTDWQAKIGANVERLYGSVEAYKTKVDGHDYQFEIGVLEGEDAEDIELRVGTFSSSLSGNHGNGFEVARLGAYNPGRSYVYVASPGNGMSSSLSPREMRYFSKHGRLMLEDNWLSEPLPVVKALGKVLLQQGIVPTRLGSDSAGAVLTTAYGAAYGNGVIKTSHQNVRTGIRDISPIALVKGMAIEDEKTSRLQSAESPDALRMRPEVLAFTKEHIHRAFNTSISPAMLLANIAGLGKGPMHGDPLVKDNQALVRNNEGVQILFTVGRDDPLAKGTGLNARMLSTVQEISAAGTGTAHAIMLERMSHGIQTHYPQFLQAIGRAILG
jgi:hypothetical protein